MPTPHEMCTFDRTGLLDKETWAAAPLTADVQAIVADLAAQTAAGPQPPSRNQPADDAAMANGHSSDRLRIGSETFCMVRTTPIFYLHKCSSKLHAKGGQCSTDIHVVCKRHGSLAGLLCW